jgi:hypothetical protein
MDNQEPYEKVDAIVTRQDLASFVWDLRTDLQRRPEEWTSIRLQDFLEALAVSLIDVEKACKFQGKDYPQSASWFQFGEILLMASAHE